MLCIFQIQILLRIKVLTWIGDLLQGETQPFKPFTHRYHVPYKASQSTAPFWYSIKRGPAHIIVLASYSAYGNARYVFSMIHTLVENIFTGSMIFNGHNSVCNAFHSSIYL